MHALEVIVARNERAAAREAAHAFNDGDTKTFKAIREATEHLTNTFSAAYARAKKEN